MNIKSIFFIILSIFSGYNFIQASKAYADYNKLVVVNHPFADMYTLKKYPHQIDLIDPYIASIPKPQQNPKAKTSLPAINESKISSPQSSIRLFENSMSLESLTDKDSISDLPSERSTDISSMTSFHASTKSHGSSTIQEISTESEQSTISTNSTSKFSAKKFGKSSTIISSQNSSPIYKIAPEPELWITNNQSGIIQITIFLRTPLRQDRYDKNDSLTYNSSSERVLIEPGQQIKIPVPLGSMLHTMQILYDPIKQTIKTRKQFFNGVKELNLSENKLNVGEKQYAHSIEINNNTINFDLLSSLKKQEIMKLPLVTDGITFPT